MKKYVCYCVVRNVVLHCKKGFFSYIAREVLTIDVMYFFVAEYICFKREASPKIKSIYVAMQ